MAIRVQTLNMTNCVQHKEHILFYANSFFFFLKRLVCNVLLNSETNAHFIVVLTVHLQNFNSLINGV